jgi:hypothetical protein
VDFSSRKIHLMGPQRFTVFPKMPKTQPGVLASIFSGGPKLLRHWRDKDRDTNAFERAVLSLLCGLFFPYFGPPAPLCGCDLFAGGCTQDAFARHGSGRLARASCRTVSRIPRPLQQCLYLLQARNFVFYLLQDFLAIQCTSPET